MDDKILVRPCWMSLVLGLVAFPAVCVPFFSIYLAFGLGVAGLVSGIQGLRLVASDKETYKGTGWAIAGIVVSAISAVIWGVTIIGQLFGLGLLGLGSVAG